MSKYKIYPGVRSQSRQLNGKDDIYYSIRYVANGIQHEEAIGWKSLGCTPLIAYNTLAKVKRAIQEGIATSLKEIREQEQEKR